MAEPVNLLTIEESQLRAMLQDPRILAILPCLQTAKVNLSKLVRGNPQCPPCEKKRRAEKAKTIRAAMGCIQSTRGGALANLKTILNAKQLRIVTTAGKGKIIKVTL